MPQVIIIALVGGFVYLLWRALRREMRRVARELERQESSSGREITELRQDSDGVYRPVNDD